MGLGGFIGDIFEDVGDLVVDAVECVVDVGADVIEGVEASIKGAMTGDPMAIASLAMTMYSGYSLYGAISGALSGGTTLFTSQIIGQTASVVGGVTGNQELQLAGGIVMSADALMKASVEEAAKGGVGKVNQTTINKVAEKQLQETLKEQTNAFTGTDIKPTWQEAISGTAKKVAESPWTETAMRTAPMMMSMMAKPSEIKMPDYSPVAKSEVYNYNPDVQIGQERRDNLATGGVAGDSRFQNINVLGRLA